MQFIVWRMTCVNVGFKDKTCFGGSQMQFIVWRMTFDIYSPTLAGVSSDQLCRSGGLT
jgi:hypothetical protein